MKTAIINIKSDTSLKKGAEAFAQELGISLSDLVNLSLRYVVTTRSITLDLRPTPNKETAKILREELADIKAGKLSSPACTDTKAAFAWLKKTGHKKTKSA
jgi:addiction module RelB/DinJ family antitoxin